MERPTSARRRRLATTRGIIVASTASALGCATQGANRLLPITTPPEAAYDCVIYELARADFTITAADRASGFVTGLRVDRNILDDPVRLEIHATVLSAPDGSGSFVQIASNAKANSEGDRLAQACAPAPEASPPHPGAF